MKICLGAYEVCFASGGVEVRRDRQLLYFNRRPVYVSVKTYGAINEFRDMPYDRLEEQDGTARGLILPACTRKRRKRRMRERMSVSGWYTVSQGMSAIRTCLG